MAGNLYVTYSLHEVIRKITPEGQVSVRAGTPGQTGARDGAGSQAPPTSTGIRYDGTDGDLDVADTVNGSVRRMAPD